MTPRSLLAPARLAGQPVLRTQSDERLVDLVRAGSEPAFEAIVTRYRRALLRYCSRILPEERAEDAVQQAFLKAYDAMRSSGAQLALRPWLYRIAHNTALNALRDRGLRHEGLPHELDGVEQPDQALERIQRLRSVLAAVQDLPERQRDAIVLRELEDRSYDEIAVELGVTDGAVRQLLNRARHSVRAAATAVTPVGLLERAPWAAAPGTRLAERTAELCAAASGGAVVAKVCATALVTGAVVGGVAVAPSREEPSTSGRPAAIADDGAAGDLRGGPSGTVVATGRAILGESRATGRGDGGGLGKHGDRRGKRAGDDEREGELTIRRGSSFTDLEDHSGAGPSGTSRGSSGSSGSGSGSSDSGSGSSDSGSGSSGSGSGSSGSGSGSSGSGSGGSDSGSGSSDSSISDSGSGSSDSSISDSGSGSSGSGSGGSDSGSG
jgi:RNA polymerase sigma factor (sigma-70 family)